MSERTKQSLIATIYAATLSPQGFNDLVADLADQLSSIVERTKGVSETGHRLPDSLERFFDRDALTDLEQHIRTANVIQQRIGHFDNNAEKVQFIADCVPSPAIVFDASERVVAANRSARRQSLAGTPKLTDMTGSRDELTKIRKAVSALGLTGDFASVPLATDLANGLNSCALLKRIHPGFSGRKGGDLFLLTIADFGFDEATRVSFRDAYGLTNAEASVAVLLASGLNAEEIARDRSVSLVTVRSQIKSIKHKTRARDLPRLVRLICGYAVGILAPNGTLTPHQSPLVDGTSASSGMFTLSDGRQMEYIVQGAPDGRSVLSFHNMPYGLVLPEAAIRAAASRGLNIIAPLRPGHGRSGPLPGVTRDDLFNQVARDADELLTHLDAPKAVLLGHSGGSSYAIRFASMFPHKVTSILMLTRAPIWKDEWYRLLPQRQKLISTMLRYMPSLANVLIWAILSYVNRQDGDDFLRQSVKESEADLRALDDPETLRLMEDGIKFGLVQGPDAFCRDWEAMDIDMTAEARALPHPMHIIQGADDLITRPEFSVAFVEQVPTATREIVKGAGNLLFYSHWRRVIDRL